jgi:tetratricopeptide (TPR) repeat protein
LELNPNYPESYDAYASLLARSGRNEEALALHRKAVELNPLSSYSIIQLGWTLIFLGRFDEGLTWFKKSLEVEPGSPYALFSIGMYHAGILGDYGEAVKWLRRTISADPGDPWNYASLGRLFMALGDPEQAERWVHRSIELGPESWTPNISMQLLHLYRGDEAAALDYGRKADEMAKVSPEIFAYQLIADHELRAGRYSDARAVYEEKHPELLGEDAPNVEYRYCGVAIDLASVLSRTGEQKRTDQLLDRAFECIQTVSRLGPASFGIADVEIYALQGDKQKALSALRQAIDEGWRNLWWYSLRLDPGLESLHEEPEFQAMVAEIEADMAEQLARVREMESNGEFEPIPEVPASAH